MKKALTNTQAATAKQAPCSFRFHSVYSIWLLVRGIVGIVGFAVGMAVLFNFSKLENKAALTIIVPIFFGLFCAIAALVTSAKLRKRSGFTANLVMLCMDAVYVAMLCGTLCAKWLGLYPMDQLRVMYANYLVDGYGAAEWAAAPGINYLAACIIYFSRLVALKILDRGRFHDLVCLLVQSCNFLNVAGLVEIAHLGVAPGLALLRREQAALDNQLLELVQKRVVAVLQGKQVKSTEQ